MESIKNEVRNGSLRSYPPPSQPQPQPQSQSPQPQSPPPSNTNSRISLMEQIIHSAKFVPHTLYNLPDTLSVSSNTVYHKYGKQKPINKQLEEDPSVFYDQHEGWKRTTILSIMTYLQHGDNVLVRVVDWNMFNIIEEGIAKSDDIGVDLFNGTYDKLEIIVNGRFFADEFKPSIYDYYCIVKPINEEIIPITIEDINQISCQEFNMLITNSKSFNIEKGIMTRKDFPSIIQAQKDIIKDPNYPKFKYYMLKDTTSHNSCVVSGGRRRKLKRKISKKRMGRKWSMKYKKSINCRRPKGFSQKQYCTRKGR